MPIPEPPFSRELDLAAKAFVLGAIALVLAHKLGLI